MVGSTPGPWDPEHAKTERVDGRLGFPSDSSQLARTWDGALDDAKRPAPDVPDLRLVPPTLAYEDGIDDHGAELKHGGIEMRDPGGDIVRLPPCVGVRRTRILLCRVLEPAPPVCGAIR
ncbi:MAG: hypothetical protein ACRDM8_03385 [Gaiellaceae bacterium]